MTVAMAENETEAVFSAIATLLVTYELPFNLMATQIRRIKSNQTSDQN